jgi:Glycosyltransferase family 10 (fucosyltransferase) C-term
LIVPNPSSLRIDIYGAFGVREIVAFNQTGDDGGWNFPRFFPIRELEPNASVADGQEVLSAAAAIAVVVNLDAKTWDVLSPRLSGYERTVLCQLEGREGFFPFAYEHAAAFSKVLTFDRSLTWHPGFRFVRLPYDEKVGSSHFDRRGFWEMRRAHGRARAFVLCARDTFPGARKKRAALIGSRHVGVGYDLRVQLASANKECVDVFGRGWEGENVSYFGRCEDKRSILRRYRWALVMENQRQPGYVTEKVLDAIVAGAVPIYWGAPDAREMLGLDIDLPGIEDLPACLEDEDLYNKLRLELRGNRRRILERFSMDQFHEGFRDCLLEN